MAGSTVGRRAMKFHLPAATHALARMSRTAGAADERSPEAPPAVPDASVTVLRPVDVKGRQVIGVRTNSVDHRQDAR